MEVVEVVGGRGRSWEVAEGQGKAWKVMGARPQPAESGPAHQGVVGERRPRGVKVKVKVKVRVAGLR